MLKQERHGLQWLDLIYKGKICSERVVKGKGGEEVELTIVPKQAEGQQLFF